MARSLWLAVALVLLLIAAGADVAPHAPAVLEGTYDCVGQNPGGAPYRGTVDIKKFGETYRLTWMIGNEVHEGVAFIDNGRLCSSWNVLVNGIVAGGVVIYKIEDTQLVGKWALMPGPPQVYTETLTKRKGVGGGG